MLICVASYLQPIAKTIDIEITIYDGTMDGTVVVSIDMDKLRAQSFPAGTCHRWIAGIIYCGGRYSSLGRFYRTLRWRVPIHRRNGQCISVGSCY